jgi:hypothetical protein
MLSEGLKKDFYLFIILIIILTVFGMRKAEGSRKYIDLNKLMEKDMIRHWKVEISGKLFNICVNRSKKTITIKGKVDDWDEMDKVENYFKHRGPSNYQVICQLDFAY